MNYLETSQISGNKSRGVTSRKREGFNPRTPNGTLSDVRNVFNMGLEKFKRYKVKRIKVCCRPKQKHEKD